MVAERSVATNSKRPTHALPGKLRALASPAFERKRNARLPTAMRTRPPAHTPTRARRTHARTIVVVRLSRRKHCARRGHGQSTVVDLPLLPVRRQLPGRGDAGVLLLGICRGS